MSVWEERRQERQRLRERLKYEGIRDQRVLDSIETVPRHLFVDAKRSEYAYHDIALEIGKGQTISQPYIVALMTESLLPQKGDRVLEIGTGSGYAAAVLSRLVDRVYTVERHAELAQEASKRFEALHYTNIAVRIGDGTKGWPEQSPFDGIVVAAAGPTIPQALKEQLTIGGRLVIPVHEEAARSHAIRSYEKGRQKLMRVQRISHEEYEEEMICYVRFVPLIGEEGWHN